MRVKDAVGRFGEDLAARHLQDEGMSILERNWRCARGELDIIAVDGSELVFVEVKTRSTAAFGEPAEALTPDKAARIHVLAGHWRAERWRGPRRRSRFDLVSVIRLGPSGPVLDHLRDAF